MSKNPAAVALGKLSGAVRSEAKAAASRENGKKGGRPRRKVAQELPGRTRRKKRQQKAK